MSCKNKKRKGKNMKEITNQETKDLECIKVYKIGDVGIYKMDDTPRNRKFEKLVLKTQGELKTYLKDYFTKEGKTVIEGKGFLYIDGSVPVLLSAHLDTVHKELPRDIFYESGMIYSTQGIGGDDRCGVYAIIRILRDIDCPVVFCEDEEIGGEGSMLFTKSDVFRDLKKKKKIKYVIDLDRKGSRDAVYYSLDNMDFENFIEKEFWKKEWGSFTDICNICPELGVAGVNLSVGYYNQHTTSEYVVLKEMDTAIEKVKDLIRRTDPAREFEYIEEVSFWGNKYYGDYGYWGGYSSRSNNSKSSIPTYFFYISYFGDKGEETEFIEAVSEAEAIGEFLMSHADLTYGDIFDYGYEEDYEGYYCGNNSVTVR